MMANDLLFPELTTGNRVVLNRLKILTLNSANVNSPNMNSTFNKLLAMDFMS